MLTVAEAARLIGRGGVVAIPTDTLYGLAADPRNAAAVARVFAIKERAAGAALPLIAADTEQVTTRLGALPPAGRALAQRFWPGPLTLLINAPGALAPGVDAGTGRVGVRVPAHDVARELCRACGWPVTSTSANISGQPPTDDPAEVARQIGDRVDMILDAGKTPGGPPSTIVDITGATPALVRAGAISWDEVLACLQRA